MRLSTRSCKWISKYCFHLNIRRHHTFSSFVTFCYNLWHLHANRLNTCLLTISLDWSSTNEVKMEANKKRWWDDDNSDPNIFYFTRVNVQKCSQCRRHSRESRTRISLRGFYTFIWCHNTIRMPSTIFIIRLRFGRFHSKTGSDMNCLFFWAAGDLIKGRLNGRIQKTPSLLTRIIKQGLPYVTKNVNESPSQRTSSERKTMIISINSLATDSTPKIRLNKIYQNNWYFTSNNATSHIQVNKWQCVNLRVIRTLFIPVYYVFSLICSLE